MKLTQKEYDKVRKDILTKTFESMTNEEQLIINKFYMRYAQNHIAIFETAKIIKETLEKGDINGN